MSGTDTVMAREAGQAAAAVRRQHETPSPLPALARRWQAQPPTVVLTCARGSSDHAATYAKYLIETMIGTPVSSASPSTASVYGRIPRAGQAVGLAISQSGGSPDLLASLQAMKAGGATTVALVNVEGSALAAAADHVAPLMAGPEHSIAATKSYIAALSRVAELVAEWSNDDALRAALPDLPDQLDEAAGLDWSALDDMLVNARTLYVIGRGVGLGVAQEAALKFKETCGLHAEAFSAAEVRHGPLAIVDRDCPLLIFRQDDAAAASIDDLTDVVLSRGGRVAVAGGARAGAITLPTVASHPALQPILQIQSFYGAVNRLAVRLGKDPDNPPHLRKVTETT